MLSAYLLPTAIVRNCKGQREAPDRPEAERYYTQHASLDAGEGVTAEAALQEAINEGAR